MKLLLLRLRYWFFVVLTAFVCTISVNGQTRIETRSGINYGFEIFEYNAVINRTYAEISSSPLERSVLKVPVLDLFYTSYNGILILGGAAGIRLGEMDEYFKVNQVNLDLFLGLGTGYFDIYFGGRGRAWYELRQKSYYPEKRRREYVTMRAPTIALSYAAIGGVRIYVMSVFTLGVEIIRNFYPAELYESYDQPDYIPAFTEVGFSPIGLKVSLGLNLYD